MSQALAFANGWNLATTLMVCVVVFHADTGNYGVVLAAEYDGVDINNLFWADKH